MMEDKIILAACAVLALLMLANMAVSIWQGRQERDLRMAMEDWKRAAAEFKGHAERTVRDVKPVLEKLEDLAAQQVQDWNAVQQEVAILDGRLGQVERRFGPLAPLEQRVDEAPDAEPDGPRPAKQEAEHD
jgi:hypothetical protein